MQKKINILVSGMHWSGSSAICDLLKEYKNVGWSSDEFDEFRRPGLVADHLEGRINTDYPSKIKRYYKYIIPKQYLSLLKKDILKNKRINILYYLYKLKKDFFRIKLLFNLNKVLLNTFEKKEKINLASTWIKDLQNLYAKNKDFIIFDQPIFFKEHLDVWPMVFNPYKLIIVYRDPRDQFTDLINRNHLFLDHISSLTGGISEIYGGDKSGVYDYHVDAIMNRYKSIDKIIKELGTECVLQVRFEDLILNYENEVSRIELFLGLKSENHINKFSFFNPANSLKNIGIYKNKLSEAELAKIDELINCYNKINKEG